MTLHGQLILELFPGAGLFGKAFEALGACVVRGPDKLWGGDAREFSGLTGRFDGVIGGPPCQFASKAAIGGSDAENLIPEFIRIVKECCPRWAVMENVREAVKAAPKGWDYVGLRDWDCGGHTYRERGFWFRGFPAPPRPAARPRDPAYSVLASSWAERTNRKGSIRDYHYTPDEAARLQGYPGLDDRIIRAQPGWQRKDGKWDGLGLKPRQILATHMLGNGVPLAMGLYVARYIAHMLAQPTLFDIPLDGEMEKTA